MNFTDVKPLLQTTLGQAIASQ